MNADMLRHALAYAAAGWPVLPLRGKVPYTRHGKDDATLDPDQLTAWWDRWPRANVGIALPPTAIALDVDPRHDGALNYAQMIADNGMIPDTLTALSGRGDGGMHKYLRHPGGELSQRALPAGIDLREGGKHYLVAPPSIHPDSGKPYTWSKLAPVADCPLWLGRMLRKQPRPVMPSAPRDPFAAGDGAGLVRFVAGLQEGERNNGLYWAARRAREDDRLDTLEPALLDAAQSIGLPAAEAAAVLKSARAGGRR